MTSPFEQFKADVEAVVARCTAGEIEQDTRDNLIRKMQLIDEVWGDTWMLSPAGDWFRRATGSKQWVQEFPIALVATADIPVAEMSMAQIARTVHECTRCPLHEGRHRAVPGEGPAPADLMLIGEGPGFNEDKQARPFVGAAGKFLEQLLSDIGYKRSDVYIANVVKCRPPNNRDPQSTELSACTDYLERQIELVNPKVIVTLGRFSMYRYFPGASITKIHGQPKRVDNRLIVPMFHPAAALHQERWKPLIIEDFMRLPSYVAQAEQFAPPQDPSSNDGEQLEMF